MLVVERVEDITAEVERNVFEAVVIPLVVATVEAIFGTEVMVVATGLTIRRPILSALYSVK